MNFEAALNKFKDISDEKESDIDTETVDKFASAIKTYCSMKSRQEKEAYYAGNQIAKKLCKIKGSTNTDVKPVYYELLEKAFL